MASHLAFGVYKPSHVPTTYMQRITWKPYYIQMLNSTVNVQSMWAQMLFLREH